MENVSKFVSDPSWHFVEQYLFFLNDMCVCMNDPQFSLLYNSLLDYVHSKFDVPDGFEIVNSYHVLEAVPVEEVFPR